MRLTEHGIVVTEIAPGVHLERDVLDQSEFRLKVAPDLKTMDSSLFQPERIGLVLRGS
jgi:acyl CoA:acetate/3-ketoacid CoA transferase